MIELAKISVLPDVRMVTLVNAGLKGLLELSNMSDTASGRLQLAVEEVFVYFVHCVKKERYPRSIKVQFAYDQDVISIRLERNGPQGDLDQCFRRSADDQEALVCHDFDPLGLKMAREFMDSIRYTYWPMEQVHQFVITYQRRPEDRKNL